MKKVLRFPKATSTPKKKVINGDRIKYFNEKQIKFIQQTVKEKVSTGNLTNLREWMIIDVLISSGIRVAEAANLRCGDLRAGYGESAIFIRCGKDSRSRTVQIPESTKLHLEKFLFWKKENGEAVGEDNFLFLGQRGAMTTQAIEKIVKVFKTIIRPI